MCFSSHPVDVRPSTETEEIERGRKREREGEREREIERELIFPYLCIAHAIQV